MTRLRTIAACMEAADRDARHQFVKHEARRAAILHDCAARNAFRAHLAEVEAARKVSS